jgi:glycosyltransferase involved in cell wall biosynthesis
VQTAVQSLAHCPAEATLTVVGRGDRAHLAELQADAARLGVADRVRFTSVPRQQIGQHYRAADAVVFPSAWEEPFGLVPLEAMASGTPVVATATGGAAEFLVDETNCLVVPLGQAATLAAALERLAADPDLRRRLVAGGRRTAAELDVDRLADHLWSWHRWAAGGGLGPPPAERDLGALGPPPAEEGLGSGVTTEALADPAG